VTERVTVIEKTKISNVSVDDDSSLSGRCRNGDSGIFVLSRTKRLNKRVMYSRVNVRRLRRAQHTHAVADRRADRRTKRKPGSRPKRCPLRLPENNIAIIRLPAVAGTIPRRRPVTDTNHEPRATIDLRFTFVFVRASTRISGTQDARPADLHYTVLVLAYASYWLAYTLVIRWLLVRCARVRTACARRVDSLGFSNAREPGFRIRTGEIV